jgi:hypothetical protein
VVESDGTIRQGSSFRVIHGSTGHYTIGFPARTWSGCTFPAAAAQTRTTNTSATVTVESCAADGSAGFAVVIRTIGSPADVESFFDFIAVRP